MPTLRSLFLASVSLLAASFMLACGGGSSAGADTCLAAPLVGASAPITRFGVHFMAGSEPLVLGQELISANGATFKASKARFYLSQPVLISDDGQRVPAELVDEAGNRLSYGVTLLDLEHPEALSVYLQAPAGQYRGLAVSIGVPQKCGSGETLNHSDASAMEAPLDVDSDMYWSWNPGYVFLKLEGRVLDDGKWENFFYHVGSDDRFVSLELNLDSPFTITADGGNGPELIADFNQLLVTPSGASHPDMTNPDQREVHGGELADSLADNLRSSGFLRLAQEHL